MACQVVSARAAAVVIQNKTKCHYRQKGPRRRRVGPIKLSILIDREFLIGIKAFRQWSKTKTNQIVI
jgi:hypothetical protein